MRSRNPARSRLLTRSICLCSVSKLRTEKQEKVGNPFTNNKRSFASEKMQRLPMWAAAGPGSAPCVAVLATEEVPHTRPLPLTPCVEEEEEKRQRALADRKKRSFLLKAAQTSCRFKLCSRGGR